MTLEEISKSLSSTLEDKNALKQLLERNPRKINNRLKLFKLAVIFISKDCYDELFEELYQTLTQKDKWKLYKAMETIYPLHHRKVTKLCIRDII